MNWFATFLYLGAAGISGALSFVPYPEFGRRFFQVHAVLLLVLVTAASAIARPLFDGFAGGTLRLMTGVVTWALIIDVLLIASLAFSRKRPIVSVAFLLPVITGACLGLAVALRIEENPAAAGLLTAHLLTGGALLGFVLVAMNLGHSYLQDAARSFDHLVRLSKLFLGSAVAKMIVSLLLLAPRAEEAWAKMGSEFDWMMVAARAACLPVYLVLGFMILSCAKARANQSATGILYGAVVFVLVGEGLSMYLTLGRGIHA